VLIYEQYRDAQALAAHRESEHFKLHAVAGSTRRCGTVRGNLIALV